jgi:hypothetical protein
LTLGCADKSANWWILNISKEEENWTRCTDMQQSADGGMELDEHVLTE